MAKKRPLPYKEGSWFAVPIAPGGYVLGVVARHDARGKALGYFFGSVHDSVPNLEEAKELDASQAAFCCFFGDLGLIKGRWPILGDLDWTRESWPLPTFIRTSGSSSRLVEYSEKDLTVREEMLCDSASKKQYPSDGLYGAKAVELVLADRVKHS